MIHSESFWSELKMKWVKLFQFCQMVGGATECTGEEGHTLHISLHMLSLTLSPGGGGGGGIVFWICVRGFFSTPRQSCEWGLRGENNKRCLRSSNTGQPHIWRKLLYFRPTITFLLAAGREVAKIGLKYQPVTYGDLYSSWSDIKKTIVFRSRAFLFIVGYFSGDHSSNFFLKIQFFIFQIEGNTF